MVAPLQGQLFGFLPAIGFVILQRCTIRENGQRRGSERRLTLATGARRIALDAGWSRQKSIGQGQQIGQQARDQRIGQDRGLCLPGDRQFGVAVTAGIEDLPCGATSVDRGNRRDTVAIWGGGPVGQLAVKSAYLLGAERAILIDRVAGRLSLARDQGKAETIDFSADSVLEGLKELTGGRGPDVCIDAVGLEAHGHAPDALLDRAKAALFLAADRAHALREAIQACRKGGTVSIPGVYGGMVDKMPMGAAFGNRLTFRMGQTHVHRYLQPLLEHIQAGEINPTFIITHRLKLDDAPAAYKMFKAHDDDCIKVVLTP